VIGGWLVRLGELPNINIPDANDGWDVALSVSLGVLALIGFLLVKGLIQVRTQVKNKHTTNLRDDVDVGTSAALEAKVSAAEAAASATEAKAASIAAKAASEAALAIIQSVHSEMTALTDRVDRLADRM